jgi:hypothetical protein
MSENIEDVKPEPVEEKVEAVAVEETVIEVAPEAPVEEVVKAPVAEDVISSPEPVESAPEVQPALAPVANGVIGSSVAEKRSKKVATPVKVSKSDTVAIHSTKNVSWVGVGKVTKGFNIVSKADADKWITRDHIRLVSPEELAKGFGK